MPSRHNRIDVHVGSRIRLRRIQLSIDRSRLAAEIGVSAKEMQQLGKWGFSCRSGIALCLIAIA